LQAEIGIEIVAIAALILSALGFIVDVFIYKVRTAGLSPALAIDLTDIRVFPEKKGKTVFEIVNKGGGRADLDYLKLKIDIYEYLLEIPLPFEDVEPMETQTDTIILPPLPIGTHELEFQLGYHYGIIRKHKTERKYAIDVEIEPVTKS